MSREAKDCPKLDPEVRNRFMRFLHVGIEQPKYYPGCWTSHKYFELGKLQALCDANESQTMEAIELVVKVSKVYFL